MTRLRVLAPACLFACGGPSRPLPPPGSPDVIVFTVDTLRADRLGYAGHSAAHTPHLDAFAARSRNFAHATTPLTRTTPALASMLTGVDPRGHGSWEVGAAIRDDIPTLAERLHAAGWATVAVSGSPVAAPKQGLGRGFDVFTVLEDPPARTLVDTALDAVGQVESDRPVLLWVHTVDPHFPYVVPEGHPSSGHTPACDALGQRFTKRPKKRWRIFSNHGGVAADALADCQRAYDVEISAVDDAFGGLLDALGPRAAGWVVVTSDHGENQGEGNLWYEHGPDARDATLRVPLLVAGPGVAAGIDNGPARLQDVAPTLLAGLGLPELGGTGAGADLLGAGRPEAAVGVSASALHPGLTRYLRSGRSHKRHCLNPPAHAVSWCSDGAFDREADPALTTVVSVDPARAAALEEAAARWPPEQARQWVARTAAWKLVATPRFEGGFAYRLVSTTDEDGADHSATHPELRARLEAVLRADSQGAAVPSPGTVAVKAGGLSPEDDEALRTLGYIE